MRILRFVKYYKQYLLFINTRALSISDQAVPVAIVHIFLQQYSLDLIVVHVLVEVRQEYVHQRSTVQLTEGYLYRSKSRSTFDFSLFFN